MPENPEQPRHRTAIRVMGWVVIAAMTFLVIEIGSLVFLLHQRDRNGQLFHFDIDEYANGLRRPQLEELKRAAERKRFHAPDSRLGWRRTPLSTHFFEEFGTTINADSTGARVIPSASGPAVISTYGDSFTEGLEVDDAETWQAHIAYATGTRVLNYGVSGYGPDQALLALEGNLQRGIHTPIVILAVINENLNRIMNTFRLFYTYPVEDIFLGFKPIFAPTDSGFAPAFFAPADITDVEAIRRALWAASRHDWFYQNRRVRIRFPFSLTAARYYARYGLNPTWWPDYSSGMPRARMQYIITRFHLASGKYGFTPVFVLLPGSVVELQTRGGHDHPVFSSIVDGANLPGLIYIDVVKELTGPNGKTYDPDFSAESFIRVTHPSAQGTRAIARVLLAKLEEQLAPIAARPGPRSRAPSK